METYYEIGKFYCFSDLWKYSVFNSKSTEIERIKHHKYIMLSAQALYEFTGDTQDYVTCPVFLPISLLGYSPARWKLDENYILPFEDKNEGWPNNPEIINKDGQRKEISQRQAEDEMCYDIKLDIESFPIDKEPKNKIPYMLLTNIQRLRMFNEDKIWLEISWKHEINNKHPDFESYVNDDVPIYKYIRCINIPLTETYANDVILGIEEIENSMHNGSKFNDFILENILTSFMLIAIIKHIYMESTNNLRFQEDVDSNKNLTDFIHVETDINKFYPSKKNIIFSDLMEMKNPIDANNRDKASEYFGIFEYMSSDNGRSLSSDRLSETRRIKVPLVLMKALKEYSYES